MLLCFIENCFGNLTKFYVFLNQPRRPTYYTSMLIQTSVIGNVEKYNRNLNGIRRMIMFHKELFVFNNSLQKLLNLTKPLKGENLKDMFRM